MAKTLPILDLHPALNSTENPSMAKALTIGGMVVAALLSMAFGLDLVLGIPFEGANMMIDIGMLLAGLMLGYMSFNAFRDFKR